MLKTLILEATPEKDHATVEAAFRGQRAHHYERLRHRYIQTHAPGWPAETSQALTFVGTWETSLRYTPAVSDRHDASRMGRRSAAVFYPSGDQVYDRSTPPTAKLLTKR